MDPEHVEPVQSDTEDETSRPQTLIPDPLDEVLKRLKLYFPRVTELMISNIEDYRMDYRFVGLRSSHLAAFGFVQLQHNSNPATYELKASRDDPPRLVDLKAIRGVNSSRIPWAVRVDENTSISEREALFLHEHLSAYKNGNDFFLSHAIYRSVPSHTVRKRYKAMVASLSKRFPQQFQRHSV
ncbi:CELF1 [Symbiodinium pilosum]|uniref:CELF1 protein n=1 Tax=Symbiodinium pilosum TaxID=2952 RepID=A0A812WYQ8_SYMPI|nr:CELF1 [Symbiodinium pilosum]